MAWIVDSHLHLVPDPMGWARATRGVRRRVVNALSPAFEAAHRAQTWLRLLPRTVRTPVDQCGSYLALPHLALGGTESDLHALLDSGTLDAAVLIAHPPFTSNHFVMEAAERDSRILPVVNLARHAQQPGAALKDFAKRGARALKIHLIADGLEPSSDVYTELLNSASDLGLPVIVHTGETALPGASGSPRLGAAERLRPWFTRYPKTSFVLAHLNFHEPKKAIALAADHENVLLETSWQPSEIITEAVATVGAERVLFGSDWPILGSNVDVGLGRIRSCVESGLLTQAQADQVLGLNAAKLYRWEPKGTPTSP